MIYQIDVTVTTPVHPTEVTDRVEKAVLAIFPEATVSHESNQLVATSHSMSTFSELLHRREILDTARSAMFNGRSGNRIQFRLSKQAAWQGVLTFAVGEPAELGDLDVDIEVHEPDVESFIDQIAPRTEDGRPVEPSKR